jgi:hypothetical protein
VPGNSIRRASSIAVLATIRLAGRNGNLGCRGSAPTSPCNRWPTTPDHYPTKVTMTMTDESSIETTKSRRSGKKLAVLLTAGVLILSAGVTFTSVSVANANTAETERLCAEVLVKGDGATKAAKASIGAADAALETVASTTLPVFEGEETAWTSTAYADRPGVDAVEEVLAVEASEGVEAVAGVEAEPARASGAEHISAVTDDRAALARIKIPAECVERDEAAAISALASGSTKAVKTLDESTEGVLADFAVFRTDEAARMAAEIEAARIAAELEAARVAAEAAARAAEEAARAEAVRKAAAQKPAPRSGGSGGYTKPPSSGGGGYVPPKTPSRPPGGGAVIPPGGSGDACWESNGTGGLKPCGT